MTADLRTRTRWTVRAIELGDGQVLRDYYGRHLLVTDVHYPAPGLVAFNLCNRRTPAAPVTLTLDLAAGTLLTYLDAQSVSQPGRDTQTGRCSTCDSRDCGTRCVRPWMADRA